MFHFSIKAKLITGLSVLLLLSFAVINILSYSVSKSSLRNNIITSSLPSISDNIYSDIHKSLLVPTHVSSLMANDTFVKDWVINGEQDTALITKYLLEIKERYGFVSTFLISHRSNRYYHFKGLHKIVSPGNRHDVWYYNFIGSNVEMDLDVDNDEAAADQMTIFINHRLTDYQGRLLGVTGVGLSLGSIGRLFADFQQRYATNVYLVDSEGVIQIQSDPAMVAKQNIRELEGLSGAANAILAASEEPTLVEYDRGNTHIILMSRLIPEFGWHLVVEKEQNEALASIRANLTRNLIIGLLVTCVVLVINTLLVNHFQGKLEHMAHTDYLTQLHNRRHFMLMGRRDFAQHKRTGEPLSLLMIDADHFKDINDKCGHEAGDAALRLLAGTMAQELRGADLLARTGGEEFAALLPLADITEAMVVAERIRSTIESMQDSFPCPLTVSIGVAEALADVPDLESLIRRADKALYNAKAQGRNRVSEA